jgi:hypothetical protein
MTESVGFTVILNCFSTAPACAAARILTRVATNLPARAACACHQALQTAFVTPPAAIPPHIRARLAPLLATHDAAPPAL